MKTKTAKRIVIVNSSPIVFQGLKSLLASAGYQVCGSSTSSTATSAEIHAEIISASPDLVILDIWLMNANGNSRIGLDLFKNLRINEPALKILLFANLEKRTAQYLIELGALGYLHQTTGLLNILKGVHDILSGDQTNDTPRVFMVKGKGRNSSQVSLPLTRRELQVFLLLGRGQDAREIASTLSISTKTAEAHLTRIKKKVRAHHRPGLAHMAFEYAMLE